MILAHLLGLDRHNSFEPVKMAIDGGCEGQRVTEALFSDAHRSHRTTPVTKATLGGFKLGHIGLRFCSIMINIQKTRVRVLHL